LFFFDNNTAETSRQRHKRERDRSSAVPAEAKRARPNRTKSAIKEEESVVAEEKPVIKRQRTLLSEFVTSDETVFPPLILCRLLFTLNAGARFGK
jgi:hypothetical protein